MALGEGNPLPEGAYTFNGWTRPDLIDLLVTSGGVDYLRILSPKLGRFVSKLPGVGIIEGANLVEAMRKSEIWVPGSRPATRTESRGRADVLAELDARAVKDLGVEKGVYTKAFNAAVDVHSHQVVFDITGGDVLGSAEINQ